MILPFAPQDDDTLAEWLVDLKGSTVRLQVPKRGSKLNLVTMANANAQQVFSDRENKARSWQGLATALGETLHLSRAPERIECLDISNIGGEKAVGALVCFVNGEASKGQYRYYKIKSVPGPDDYAMMGEVLRRRLSRGAEEGGLPDLLLLDGGKGQLNVALAVIKELELTEKIDLAAIAKEREEEGEKLFRPGRKNPVLLPAHSPVLLLLMRIRDEAHRYGITFHRRWRRKDTLASEIDFLPGVGPQRKKAMLATLGSLKRIMDATVEELAAVPGIGPGLAERIWKRLHAAGSG